MFEFIINTLDLIIDADYGALALKAVVKTAEIGIEIVKWSLQ